MEIISPGRTIFSPVSHLINSKLLSKLFVLLFILAACISGCVVNEHSESRQPLPGEWKLVFDLTQSSPGIEVPVRLTIDTAGLWSVHNGNEVIRIDSVSWIADSFHVRLPFFHTFLSGRLVGDSLLEGVLTEPSRAADYIIPFRAYFRSEHLEEMGAIRSTTEYDVSFSVLDSTEKTKAIAVFDDRENILTGTFLTESGDFRYLQGESDSTGFRLACFDGAHLFYFTGRFVHDSIVDGMFYSGVHWSEPWEARQTKMARLRDPDSITFVSPAVTAIQFQVRDQEGNEKLFNKDSFKDKVSVVQIFGSWCPNCVDESLFLKSLYERYGSEGLQVIPVAFERSENFEENRSIVRRQAMDMGLPYPVYFGGKRKDASTVFSMLNDVLAFPTALIIDKNGEVRKVHTGFYGPATGSHYISNTRKLESFIVSLLSES